MFWKLMAPDQPIATRRSLLDRIKHWEDHRSWQDFYEKLRLSPL
jgi:hypothetical protein